MVAVAMGWVSFGLFIGFGAGKGSGSGSDSKDSTLISAAVLSLVGFLAVGFAAFGASTGFGCFFGKNGTFRKINFKISIKQISVNIYLNFFILLN